MFRTAAARCKGVPLQFFMAGETWLWYTRLEAGPVSGRTVASGPCPGDGRP
jgi:hypothetical protein